MTITEKWVPYHRQDTYEEGTYWAARGPDVLSVEFVIEHDGIGYWIFNDGEWNRAHECVDMAEVTHVMPRAVPPRPGTEPLEKLEELRLLQVNWDGRGAQPPSDAAMDRAKHFLQWSQEIVSSETRVAPDVEGGVAIYFFGGERMDDGGWSRRVGVFIDNDGESVLCLRNREALQPPGTEPHRTGRLEKVKVWYSIEYGWDGSACPRWFLTQGTATDHQENQDELLDEMSVGDVDTFVGSDIHLEALVNSGDTTLDIGTGTPVTVAGDPRGMANAVSLIVWFSGGVWAWGDELEKCGWDGVSPVIWSFNRMRVEVITGVRDLVSIATPTK